MLDRSEIVSVIKKLVASQPVPENVKRAMKVPLPDLDGVLYEVFHTYNQGDDFPPRRQLWYVSNGRQVSVMDLGTSSAGLPYRVDPPEDEQQSDKDCRGNPPSR